MIPHRLGHHRLIRTRKRKFHRLVARCGGSESASSSHGFNIHHAGHGRGVVPWSSRRCAHRYRSILPFQGSVLFRGVVATAKLSCSSRKLATRFSTSSFIENGWYDSSQVANQQRRVVVTRGSLKDGHTFTVRPLAVIGRSRPFVQPWTGVALSGKLLVACIRRRPLVRTATVHCRC